MSALVVNMDAEDLKRCLQCCIFVAGGLYYKDSVWWVAFEGSFRNSRILALGIPVCIVDFGALLSVLRSRPCLCTFHELE